MAQPALSHLYGSRDRHGAANERLHAKPSYGEAMKCVWLVRKKVEALFLPATLADGQGCGRRCAKYAGSLYIEASGRFM